MTQPHTKLLNKRPQTENQRPPASSFGDLQNGCYVQSGATTKIEKAKT